MPQNSDESKFNPGDPHIDNYPPPRNRNYSPSPPSIGMFSALLLLILIAFAIWYLFIRDTTGPEESAGDDPPSLACDEAGFASRAGESTDNRIEALESCGEEVSAEIRLRELEAGARAENGRALLLLGELYDPGAETVGQPVFSRSDPAIAAEYYFRALAAGSAEAADRLETVCGILDPNDPLQEFNRSQYCGE